MCIQRACLVYVSICVQCTEVGGTGALNADGLITCSLAQLLLLLMFTSDSEELEVFWFRSLDNASVIRMLTLYARIELPLL